MENEGSGLGVVGVERDRGLEGEFVGVYDMSLLCL